MLSSNQKGNKLFYWQMWIIFSKLWNLNKTACSNWYWKNWKILHKYTTTLKFFLEISFTFLLLQSSCSILLLLFGISHLPTTDSIFLGRLASNRDVLLHSITLGPSQDLPGQFPCWGTRHILQVLFNNNIRCTSTPMFETKGSESYTKCWLFPQYNRLRHTNIQGNCRWLYVRSTY